MAGYRTGTLPPGLTSPEHLSALVFTQHQLSTHRAGRMEWGLGIPPACSTTVATAPTVPKHLSVHRIQAKPVSHYR